MTTEMEKERQHLASCLDLIRENVKKYEKSLESYEKETKELFLAVQSGDVELYDQLAAAQNILEHTQNTLRKNRTALDKTYFGRIDYEDRTFDQQESLYIGKNGISNNRTEVVIVDWRAPAATVYYENAMGAGSYPVPDEKPVEIDLKLKRTYDIEGGELFGYYEDDVAANDELLVKYLAQNKDAVLGDIIATIQKEQNQIIREIPYKNIIVQGVAGSGKTTVALHRISYLLYNYDKRYKPSEFCIVGGSDMLLDYIASGLPELDVHHVKQMRMDQFLPYIMEKAFRKKYKCVAYGSEAAKKSRLSFMEALERFLKRKVDQALGGEDIVDAQIGVLMSRQDMENIRMHMEKLSLFQLEKLYNERLAGRIRFLTSEEEERVTKEKLSLYRRYFHSQDKKETEPQVYLAFLRELEEKQPGSFSETTIRVQKLQFDLYDIAALAVIWKRIFVKKQTDEFSQVFVDEAQDFGESIYYSIRQVLTDCYFTIMGDVSQNIYYETGMNDWDGLQRALFCEGRDSLYLLQKSYRNTIEISEEAGKVLDQASGYSYKIEPVIRHGKPVEYLIVPEKQLMKQLRDLLDKLLAKGYQTVAVITRFPEEAEEIRTALGMEQADTFSGGVMILPVTATKGLEFDAVVIWKADDAHYENHPRDAKLLYVAITRALHELYILGDEKPSILFGKNHLPI